MGYLSILADGIASDIPTAASVIGAAGFSGVMAWYLVTKAIPRLQDQHVIIIKDLTDRFDKHITLERDFAKTESTLWRDMHKADSAETRAVVKELCNEIRTSNRATRDPAIAPKP